MKKFQPWVTLSLRILLAALLIIAGWIKAMNPSEAQSSVRVYEILPTGLANTFGLVLPWLEIGVGLLLLLGIWVKWSSAAAGFLMLIFIIAISQAWARKLPINCGCFGNGGITADGKVHPMVYLTEIVRDIGLLLCAGFLFKYPRGKFGIDDRRA